MVNAQHQWGIYWADLNPIKGSERAGTRPVLVVSSEIMNEWLPVVTIISIISLKPNRILYPIEVLLLAEDTGLTKDSIAMAHQIRSISKDRLGQPCGFLASHRLRKEVQEKIKIYLDMV
jgi:mRNA interferase MazF